MKYFLVLMIMLCGLVRGYSQEDLGDTDLLRKKVAANKKTEDNGGGLYRLYQDVFSEQILNDCIYDRSCSAFSKDVFHHFGPLKGLMLTVDRLTRCNRATYAQISEVLTDKNGRALDHWDYYVKKK